MSSPSDPARGADARPPAARWKAPLALARDALAVAGVVLAIASAYVLAEGRAALGSLDPGAGALAGHFTRNLLEEGFAAASSVRIPLEEGVTPAAATQAIAEHAKRRKLTILARHDLGPALAGDGDPPPRHLVVFTVCDPRLLARLVDADPALAAHSPCRIAVHAGTSGDAAVYGPDLDLLIRARPPLEEPLRTDALALKDTLLALMVAGATGVP